MIYYTNSEIFCGKNYRKIATVSAYKYKDINEEVEELAISTRVICNCKSINEPYNYTFE